MCNYRVPPMLFQRILEHDVVTPCSMSIRQTTSSINSSSTSELYTVLSVCNTTHHHPTLCCAIRLSVVKKTLIFSGLYVPCNGVVIFLIVSRGLIQKLFYRESVKLCPIGKLHVPQFQCCMPSQFAQTRN